MDSKGDVAAQKFVVGSRKSKLAMIQTRWVIQQLEDAFPDHTFEIHEMDTKGDIVLEKALSKIGDKGLFTQELEQGMLDGTIDFAVHSLKDLPTTLPEGLVIGCITQRLFANDVLVVRSDLVEKGITTIQQLQDQSVTMEKPHLIGTSSLRRHAQIAKSFPNLECVDCRGNVDTRLAKLDSGNYSAIVLAQAGLERQGAQYAKRICQILPEDQMLYAVGQGALGIECRADNERVLELLKHLHHEPTAKRCRAERAFLRHLEGGCHTPIGVSTCLSENNTVMDMKACVLSLDGSQAISHQMTLTADANFDPEVLGVALAKTMLEKGAHAILQSLNK